MAGTQFTTNLVNGTTKAKTPGTVNNPVPKAPYPDITKMFKAAGGVVNRPATGVPFSTYPKGGFASPQTQAYTTQGVTGTDQSAYTGAASAPAAPAAPVDPYAKWGGLAAFQKLNSDFQASKGSAYSSITDLVNNGAANYEQSIGAWGQNLKKGQTALDDQQVDIELGRGQGGANVLDMIGTGVRSGGVQLANMNAGTSSAGEALAQAWGTTGNKAMGQVNNKYFQDTTRLNQDQDRFLEDMDYSGKQITDSKVTVVNDIVSRAAASLSDLNAKAASASLEDRIGIEAEKNRIRNETMAKLNQYDGQFAESKGKFKKMDNSVAKGKAKSLQTTGLGGDMNPFDFTTQVPQAAQGTGPFASELPIFTKKRLDEK